MALFFAISASYAQELPHWTKQGTATQMTVNDKPMLLLAGELGNSSASSPEDIESIFPKLKRIGLNTVLVPAYWDLIEPEEGKFDFSLINKTITEARKQDMKVVFLWFGAWKNSMSCYAPLWFKSNYKKYPRCYTEAGKPLEIASPFSENVFEADSKAFVKLMSHIKDFDSKESTVIMIQVENEIGMLESARDHSKTADKLFKSSIDEIFMAWQYAAYVEKMIQKGREVYNLPMYVNAAMNSRNRKPGEYPSAGPLAHLIDIWKCAAPSIDLLAPDLYDKGFVDWVAQYKLHNNPLFIPEIKLEPNDGVRAFYVFGQHDAIGFSPFSIEDAPDDGNYKLTKAYAKLEELMPLIIKYQGKEQMKGILFDQTNKEKNIEWDGITLSCKHFFTLPWDARATDGSVWPEGGGIIIKLDRYEYIVAGSGIVIEFKNPDELKGFIQKKLGEDGFIAAGGNTANEEKWYAEKRIGIGSVDEVSIDEEGNMKYLRRLNGDQDHQGRHVRIGVDDFSILHVKLYEYK